MKRFAITTMLILAASMSALANTLPAGKDTKEFMVGVTGIFVELKGGELRVTKVTPKTPAAGKLQVGDVLLAVDGAKLDIQDPRHPLGFAINKAEGRDGRMKFAILRGKAKRTVISLVPEAFRAARDPERKAVSRSGARRFSTTRDPDVCELVAVTVVPLMPSA